MQKELILVLLGIICTSFLSSFLSEYSPAESDKVLLDTVVGAVGSGNFSYWQLGHNGPLLIELTSLSGDADLFVADNIRPSYEVDQYNFSSATCGQDVVSVPMNFPRPLGLGVFGHWSHSVSEYAMRVYLDTPALMAGEQMLAYERASTGTGDVEPGEDMDLQRSKDTSKPPRKHEEESRPRFLKLLSILDMIFEMFVL